MSEPFPPHMFVEQATVADLFQDLRQRKFVIPVDQDGPVNTHELPAIGGAALTVNVVGPTPVRVVGQDPKRKRLVVLAPDRAVWLGFDPTSVGVGYGFLLAQGVQLSLSVVSALYAAPPLATAADAVTRVSVISEQWTR